MEVGGLSFFVVFSGALSLGVMEGEFGSLEGLKLVLDELDDGIVVLHGQSSLFLLHPIL
jgi:hypothetical protein